MTNQELKNIIVEEIRALLRDQVMYFEDKAIEFTAKQIISKLPSLKDEQIITEDKPLTDEELIEMSKRDYKANNNWYVIDILKKEIARLNDKDIHLFTETELALFDLQIVKLQSAIQILENPANIITKDRIVEVLEKYIKINPEEAGIDYLYPQIASEILQGQEWKVVASGEVFHINNNYYLGWKEGNVIQELEILDEIVKLKQFEGKNIEVAVKVIKQ